MTEAASEDVEQADEIDEMIQNVRNGNDFIEFLEAYEKVVFEDEEEKHVEDFLRVLAACLRWIKAHPEPGDLEIPDQPDWRWVAKAIRKGVSEM